MLILNYYYNNYDEVDVYTMNDGNGTSSANVAVIVGATVGGIFAFIILMVVICVCCRGCRDISDDSEEVEVITHTTTVIEHKDIVYPEGFNPNYPPS